MGRHGDIRLAAKFLSELPDQITRDAMQTWLCTFGCVSATNEGRSLRFERRKTTRLGAGMHKPYWQFISKKRAAVRRVNTKRSP